MLRQLDKYNWQQAFGYAGESETYGSPNVSPVPGSAASGDPFGREDVVLLLGLDSGERDGPAWVCAGRLSDKRWFCLRASCDYSGWDCHAHGHASVALSLGDLLRLGMNAEERARCSLDVDLAMLEGTDDEYIEREVVALVLRR